MGTFWSSLKASIHGCASGANIVMTRALMGRGVDASWACAVSAAVMPMANAARVRWDLFMGVPLWLGRRFPGFHPGYEYTSDLRDSSELRMQIGSPGEIRDSD